MVKSNNGFFDEEAGEGDEESGSCSEIGEDNHENPESEQVVNPYLQLRQNRIKNRKRMEKDNSSM